jgi:hypothetical protein
MARPPRLPDSAILTLIAELRSRHALLTGTRLREELKQRFGTPGGVARIYRLMHQAAAPVENPSSPTVAPNDGLPTEVIQLQEELRIARERAALAEHREEHHQARWAGEIHQLREQVHTLREGAHRLAVLEQDVLDRSRELASAYRRIADLEEQLLRAQ